MSLDRRVLAQDLPQYEQSTKAARKKQNEVDEAAYNAEVERVNKENIEIEKQNAEAEAKYQKELEEYNKQKALAEAAEDERTKLDYEIGRLQKAKGEALGAVYGQFTSASGNISRGQLQVNLNAVSQNYDSAINKVVEQKRVLQGYQEFAALYPGQPIPRSVQKAFVGSRGSTVSIGTFAKTFYEGKAAKAEYDRQTSIQQARSAPSYTPQQTKVIETGFSGYRGTPTQDMLNRDVRPAAVPQGTIFPFTPYVAQDKNQVRGLINVKTVENIYGGQQIPTNPRAYVKGLERNIPQPGTPIRTQPIDAAQTPEKIFSFQNISEVKDPGAIALLEFQSQLKTQTAPNKGVYQEILKEKGLKETPLTKRIITEYSSKPVKEYSTRAEAFGLDEAKGNKPFYVNPLTGESFDTQTLKGNQKLAESLGYKFEASKPTDKLQGPWSFGFPQNYYVIPDAFGVPRTDKSGNPIMVKSEETAKKLSERLSQKPSVITVKTPEGGLTITSTPEKEKPLSSSGERFEYFLKKIEEVQPKYAKYTNEPFTGSLTVKVGLEIGKDIVGTGAFLENLGWQGEALVRGGTPKTREVQIPEILSFNVADDVFSGKFEKIPSTVKAYESKYGQGSAIGAAGLTLVGLPIKTGGKLLLGGGIAVAKKVLPQSTKLVKKEGIALTVKGGSRSAQWDASENIITKPKGKVPVPKGETVGFRPTKIEKLEANPYGKERKIPYALRQAQEKIVSQSNRLKDSFQVIGSKTKRMVKVMNVSPNLTIIESRNVIIPNVTRPERNFSKIDAIKVSLGIYTKRTVKPFVRGMGEVWQGNAEKTSLKQRVPKPQTKFGQYLSEQRIQRKIFVQKVKNIKVPELKTPEPIKRAKKGLQGYAFMQKKRFVVFKESLPSKPTLPKISFETKASRRLKFLKEVSIFKQKESLRESRNAMRKVLEGPVEKPKEIVEFKSKNTLSNIKSSLKGIEEPIEDFFSKVKSWQKAPQLKGLIQGVNPLFGKVKGLTSRQEFGNLLKDDLNLPQTKLGKFPFRSKKDILFRVSYDEGRQFLLSDIQKIRGKGLDVIEQRNKMFDMKKGSYRSSDTGFELVRDDLASLMQKPRGIYRIKADTQSLVRRGKLRVSAEIKSGKIKNIFIDLNLPKTKSFIGLKTLKFRSDINDILFKSYRFRDLQKSERYSVIFSKPRLGTSKKRMDNLFVQTQQVGSEIKTGENINFVRNEFVTEKSVKDLIGEGVSKGGRTNKARLEGLKNLAALSERKIIVFKIPKIEPQITKYPVGGIENKLPSGKTELDRILESIKKESKREIPWKLNPSDILNVKLAKDLLKDNEKYRAIGITAGAGSIGLLSTQQEAEALPFPQILVKSGGQVLIQETKPSLLKDISIPYVSTKLFGSPETIKGEEKYRLESKPETKLSTIPKIKLISTPLISQYQPQKLQESVKLSNVTRQKLGTPQKLVQREKQKTETIQRQKFILTPVLKQMQKQTPKLATPSPLKQPTKQTPTFKLKQPIKLTLRYRDPPPSKPPRLVPLPLLPPKEEKKREPRKPQPGSKADFLGNVPESQIGGIFNRIETTYGQRKINRLLAGDVRVTKGGRRSAPRRSKPFVEGKGKDMFGFNQKKKNNQKSFKLSF